MNTIHLDDLKWLGLARAKGHSSPRLAFIYSCPDPEKPGWRNVVATNGYTLHSLRAPGNEDGPLEYPYALNQYRESVTGTEEFVQPPNWQPILERARENMHSPILVNSAGINRILHRIKKIKAKDTLIFWYKGDKRFDPGLIFYAEHRDTIHTEYISSSNTHVWQWYPITLSVRHLRDALRNPRIATSIAFAQQSAPGTPLYIGMTLPKSEPFDREAIIMPMSIDEHYYYRRPLQDVMDLAVQIVRRHHANEQ